MNPDLPIPPEQHPDHAQPDQLPQDAARMVPSRLPLQ
jgi:hypothetical protein